MAVLRLPLQPSESTSPQVAGKDQARSDHGYVQEALAMFLGRIARNENRYDGENGNTRAEAISVQCHDLFLVHRDALAVLRQKAAGPAGSGAVRHPNSPLHSGWNPTLLLDDGRVPARLRLSYSL